MTFLVGKFGWQCKFDCHCKNGEDCDMVTGQCDSGCQTGLYDNGCQFGKSVISSPEPLGSQGELIGWP